jgi:AmpD protein
LKPDSSGWLSGTRRVISPNQDARPAHCKIELLVIHSISLPPNEYGGDAIERFFTNALDHSEHPYFEQLKGVRVSSHFLVRRTGQIVQFVPCSKRAWHAGVSTWRGRARCNDFSIGIELEGLEGGNFEPAQYECLIALLPALAAQYPLRHITGHEHIAPGRKFDPGAGLDWVYLQRCTGFAPQCFPDTVSRI